MLTGVRIIVMGGDARQLEVIQKCAELDATVSVVGFDKLEYSIPGIEHQELEDDVFASADVLVLPVVGCDDQGKVSTSFSDTSIFLKKEHVAALPEHCIVFTGMAKPFLRDLCRENGLRLVEVLDRDDIALYNSIPTAEGAIAMAIRETDFTIHGSECIVLGLGRTGFTMAKTLQGLGANVRVGIRREEDAARAAIMGWKPFMTTDLAAQTGDVDLLFNTIPTMIITAQILSKMPQKAVIIDLASAPGGCDFRYAEKRGIKALLAPGLPGIVAPKTAGGIIADVLIRLLLEEQNAREVEQ
ncbi:MULTISPECIES: dipicolinate synthase subunit DpsA [Paenibacillus]|uniref:dipicolinate synthase subunit DpsA n=1 Tax=Paenibacillus TaxID=44249 RepID=UPI00040E3560|nr:MULTISPECIES: dipicolinate synthase subunit DpsA [Paenibacillus]KGP80977.1 dipicolinate synthase subunit A [Paenibacillus sp. MAEPY1]KGP82907.1 dipicolinate synthase subunit A [Paenibacillus sp. MAEPY2]OZQ73724.1 dipicolinic acid synthetase subunit A [Paenibacillus taichungensis]HBU84953.1 dipicolinate synthase subunit DpsA [Paenibacillus sp.]